MKLFEEYPDLTGERIRIRHMAAEDAPALQRLAENRNVYRYLPIFLYEQKYEDKAEVTSAAGWINPTGASAWLRRRSAF